MILELIVSLIFGLLELLIALIPQLPQIPVFNDVFDQVFQLGLFFLGTSTFTIVMANTIMWLTIDYGYVVFEWILKKLPFFD